MSSSPWPASTARRICSPTAASAPSRSPAASAAASASPRVLGRELERERGRELAVDHHRPLELRVGRADRRAVDRRRGRSAGRRRAPRPARSPPPAPRSAPSSQVLRTSLRRWAAPASPSHSGLRADRVEDRVDALAQRPRGRRRARPACPPRPAAVVPEHRGVDERDAGRLGAARQALGGGDADRAHLREHRAVHRPERLLGDRLDGRRRRRASSPRRRRRRPPRPRSRRPCTPSSASGSAFSGERFQARTSWPGRARLRAIGAPMIPVPRTATRISSAGGPRCRRAGSGRGAG